MSQRRFAQLDVFSDQPFGGNPLAVIVDAEGLSDEQMLRIAAWTNLSETTFLLPPTQPGADYRVRIMTTSGELPFAGHPTLGSARAWLEAGGRPMGEKIVQECAAGLVSVRRDGERLAFAAPPLQRSGPLETAEVSRIAAALGIAREEIVGHAWADNGPGWQVVELASAQAVLDLEPQLEPEIKIGVIGRYAADAPHPRGAAYEVRALLGAVPSSGASACEDPVTGSLNAGVAQWLLGRGELAGSWIASQGARLGRSGLVHVQVEADDGESVVWIGGHAVTRIAGTLAV
ncbi:phenazine biosynthesis protein PhzF [Brachybacterium phenoliresistens]|uniref:Phenazine biosynthesis protein PhzF n=1 Tax=Brachybacterium phenoliresistens TaxID=396014 RepID=Z9JTQ3_9MICO|nr:PhzF family phenazine biosynthesis protein [Brachybacterium phenoliresistens]EWS81765.1 phenazine biosynthesis protein PhzF [Brachybacterium phenoliresistens]